jgi:hypothetical protein
MNVGQRIAFLMLTFSFTISDFLSIALNVILLYFNNGQQWTHLFCALLLVV